jgi:nucleoside permease NupC
VILLRALVGVVVFIGLAWLISWDRKKFPWRVVVGGLLLQVVLITLITQTTAGRVFFEGAAAFVNKLVSMTVPGASAVFGHLATDGGAEFVFAFAGTGLIVIIFVSALMSVLYHLGVMQVLVWALAKVMRVTIGFEPRQRLAFVPVVSGRAASDHGDAVAARERHERQFLRLRDVGVYLVNDALVERVVVEVR